MSVVVIGMDYPDNCCVCKIKFWDIEGYVCPFSGVDTLSIGRQTNCPLRPLPEKHGRLGDLDEVKTAFPCGESVRTECVRATIDNMPTIVEAEGDDGWAYRDG